MHDVLACGHGIDTRTPGEKRGHGVRRPRSQVLPLAPTPPSTASAAAINRLMRDTDSRNSLAIAVIVMPHSRYAIRSASAPIRCSLRAILQRAGRLALRLRNIARAALLGGRERLHASDESFVAKEDLPQSRGQVLPLASNPPSTASAAATSAVNHN